uniref:Immunoglobulin V-set domain-containing protein n=1 Tax=Nothoprocta perdicaria TaxID=30464 RepID=A0A8C6ZQC5_NOTPE
KKAVTISSLGLLFLELFDSAFSDSYLVEQSPPSLSVEQGESITINCSLKSSHEEDGIFLLKTHMKPERVLYVSRQNASTISTTFANRLEYSKEEETLVVTLHNLQKNDSDIYVAVLHPATQEAVCADSSAEFCDSKASCKCLVTCS